MGELWLTKGQLSPDEVEQLERLTSELDSLYDRHIAAEDNEVFPLAARVLSPVERQVIGEEMAARRGLGSAPAR